MTRVAFVIELAPCGALEPFIGEARRIPIHPSQFDLGIPIGQREALVSTLDAEILCGAIPLRFFPQEASGPVDVFLGSLVVTRPAVTHRAFHFLDHLFKGERHYR